MTSLVLLILAAIWAAVLLPPFLEKRRATHPSSSVVDFHQQLAVLQRTGDALHGAPLRDGYAEPSQYDMPDIDHSMLYRQPPRNAVRPDVMRRRSDIFTTLLGAAGITFVLAVLLGGGVWMLHLVVDAMLLGYVAMLLQIQQTQTRYAARPARRPASVHPLDRAQQSYTQQALLRRQAN